MKMPIQRVLRTKKKRIQRILRKSVADNNIETIENLTKIITLFENSEVPKCTPRVRKAYAEEIKSKIKKIKSYFQSIED